MGGWRGGASGCIRTDLFKAAYPLLSDGAESGIASDSGGVDRAGAVLARQTSGRGSVRR